MMRSTSRMSDFSRIVGDIKAEIVRRMLQVVGNQASGFRTGLTIYAEGQHLFVKKPHMLGS
jgi:hypothetical protein